MCVKDGALSVKLNNACAGRDPALGMRKELRIEYSVDGAQTNKTVK